MPHHFDYPGLGGSHGLGVGLGVALTAWLLGFRHPFGAAHFSCTDNPTRKLMASGERPLGPAFVLPLHYSRVVLAVAGLDRAHYFKGVPVLLAALAELPPGVRGVFVGDGDLRPAYEALAGRLGITGRVSFAGRVAERSASRPTVRRSSRSSRPATPLSRTSWW